MFSFDLTTENCSAFNVFGTGLFDFVQLELEGLTFLQHHFQQLEIDFGAGVFILEQAGLLENRAFFGLKQ